MPLAGRPMVEWSIAAFRAVDSVRSIVVACPPGHDHELSEPGLEAVEGGATRSQSVSNAMQAVDTELVAIHDAARPLVTPVLIGDLIAALVARPDSDGVIAAAPVTDTIKQAASGDQPPPRRNVFSVHKEDKTLHLVESTLDRSRLWAAQTPQVFRAEELRAALADNPDALGAATDEAMLIEAAGGKVLIHSSPAENLKVTTQLDLKLAESLLTARAD